MGIISSNKRISADKIACDGALTVTLALTASPDIASNPTDIVLILDRSGSMTGAPLANMKAGARTFIDIIDEATDGAADGQIGMGSHIGIVSFATTAAADAQLITSVADLKAAVDGLTAGGQTNHAAAFTQAMALFDPASTNHKVMVMFTDGVTTIGAPPAPVAAAARAAGVVIYCIGLIGADGVDVATLNDWASDPDATHVAVTPDDAKLEELFADLAANISKPGATDIVIDELLNPDFAITGVQQPTRGSVSMVNATTLRWTIASLGVTANESATLSFTIRHDADTGGVKNVNESIAYRDNEGNQVTFPSPQVRVDCSIVVHPEDCPEPVQFTIQGCQDALEYDAGELFMESQGRVVQVDVTVRNVCPGKRTALAVILNEVDEHGLEHPRGLKTAVLPAHDAPACRDVRVRCIKFVLPESLDVSGGSPLAMCNPRTFKAVSYTHLDVYKRQRQRRCLARRHIPGPARAPGRR